MQLKHWENLANLERSIVKEQFTKVAKQPADTPAALRQVRRVGKQRAERKIGKDNKPQVASITAVTGDAKIPNPYRKRLVGKGKYKKGVTEKDIRDQRGKTAALVAQDGLTPAGGGAQGMLNEHAAMWGQTGKPLYRPRLKTKTQVL